MDETTVSVTRSVTLNAPLPEVWGLVGNFHGADRWHPAIAESIREAAGEAEFRLLKIAGGGEILERLGAKPPLVDEVCDIVGHHHHPRKAETLNFKVIYDADWIANLEDRKKENGLQPEKIETIIAEKLLTENGRIEARKTLLG